MKIPASLVINCIFITLFCSQINADLEEKVEKKESNHEDESEWRVLEEGETVPRGSHVQIDLTTKERRIKVIKSERTDKEKTSVVHVKTDDKITDKKISDKLSYKLQHILGDDVEEDFDEKKDSLKRKFKSYNELKKDIEDLHLAVKTDIEIMNSILESYKELVEDKVPITKEAQEQQMTMLTDLEYLLHQIDNANEFVRSGGMSNIILPSLNSTSAEVRSGSARLLGSAAQSNIAVQIAALESGTIGILLRILALDKTPSVRSSTLYALSCLVRRFPSAQKKLVDEGGLTVLNNLFNSDDSDKLKIQVKVLNLINDLIVEKQEAEKTFTLVTEETNSNVTSTSVSEAKERLRQYNLIGLETKLQEQNWCSQLSSLLIEHTSQHLDIIIVGISSESDNFVDDVTIDHDVIEKVIKAMISFSNLCLSDYENNYELKEIVRVLLLWYKKLSEFEKDDDSYYKLMSHLLEHHTWLYSIPFNKNLKDEL